MRDTFEKLTCPACGCEMKKVFIESAKCYVDICADGCGGIYFDNRELEKFDENHENIDEILKEYKDKKYEKQDENKTRICPFCATPMVKNYASHFREIQIDECYSCGGKFLDYQELEKIRAQFETEEKRIESFNRDFESKIDISDFKDYKYKTKEEIFENTYFIGKIARLLK